MTLFENKLFADVKWGEPSLMTRVCVRRGEMTQRHIHKGEAQPWDSRGRHWRDAAAHQILRGAIQPPDALEETGKDRSPET